MTIKTKDLWQSAYLLSEGGWLDSVQVERCSDGKKKVTFCLTGDGMDDLTQRFQDGEAVCNVKKLKANVSHLKQMIFGGNGRTRG
jgi:hypothetical protein